MLRIVRLAPIAVLALLCACSAAQQRQAQGTAQDALIATGVSSKLTSIDLDASTNVHVAVRNGAVTLSGQARSVSERNQYAGAARGIDGVSSVTNDLTVDPHLHGAQESVDDAALAAKVTGALAAQTGVNAFHVKPSVRGGVVTLNGTVDSSSVKATMLAAVRKLNGVKRVVDNIEVKP
ncbi:MAG TPA: BON domain-containing protein [Candidatus Baltobacteraceae bacterium]|jgi:hyperosmotically inducible protein